MLNIDNDVRWDLFTDEERKIITEVYKLGEYKHFTCLPNVVIDTPAKEREIEKLVLDLMEINLDDESEVKDAINKYLAEGGLIDTPAKEAEWQARLDAEQAEKKAKIEKRKEELRTQSLAKLGVDTQVEEDDEEEE